jgi:hypothetical protein
LRRTKVSLIYRRRKNLRAVRILLGHAKPERNVRYLGIEVDDAREIVEQTRVGFPKPVGDRLVVADRSLEAVADCYRAHIRTTQWRFAPTHNWSIVAR